MRESDGDILDGFSAISNCNTMQGKHSRLYELISGNAVLSVCGVFDHLERIDYDFFKFMGGEIHRLFTTESLDACPDISQLDEKLLRYLYLCGYYSLADAEWRREQLGTLCKARLKSYIRYQRLGQALRNTAQLLENAEERGANIQPIVPQVGDAIERKVLHSYENLARLEPSICAERVEISCPIVRREERPALTDDDLLQSESRWIYDIQKYSSESYRLYRLPKSRITAPPAAIYFEDADRARFLWGSGPIFHYFFVSGHVVQEPVLQSVDKAWFLPRFGCDNHYHALVDQAPALYAYAKLGLNIPILSTYQLGRVELLIAEKLGINRDNIIVQDAPNYVSSVGLLPDINSFRQDFFRYCGNLGSAKTDYKELKLYISRYRSKNRPLVNELEVHQCVERHGFHVVYLEELSIEEQIETCSQAKVILGPHGAGLSNAVFSKPGSTLIELLPNKYMVPFFRQLAIDCGHRYGLIVGNTNTGYDSNGPDDISWSVDVNRLDMNLAALN